MPSANTDHGHTPPRGRRPRPARALPTRRYHIRHLRDDLVHRVKILAAHRRETMETIFNRALEQGLEVLESER